MKLRSLSVLLSLTILFLAESSTFGEPITKNEVDYQNQAFKQWYGTTLVWRYKRLPQRGEIPKHRIPYAGAIYPDREGGTASVLAKYDRAFHGDQAKASQFEQRDVAIRGTTDWAGHCNGWTAAAIRHAEPRRNVTRNRVVFTPADIKGLLAELYVYAQTEFLGGVDPAINPGTLHVVVANWIGLGKHPIGVETTLGQEVWNYPAYNFSSEAHFRDERHVEVRLKLGCVDFLPYEVDKAPKKPLDLHFHYLLTLNEDGEIVDGTYLYDSKRIDMLWVPMTATRGGTAGNEDGNPHIDPDVIIGMWRESVPETLRTTWYVVDPLPEDAVLVSDWFHVSPTADDARLEYIPDLTQDRAANLESAAERTPTAPHQARTASAETEPAAEQYSVTATTDGQAPSSDAAVESTDQQSSHDVVVEVVRERFPDGSLKAEREVTLDSDLNYINHGMYRLWWESGALRAEDRLEHGRRVGVWRRIYAKNESDLFSEMPFKFFREPFLSTATFRDERLHGKWSIRDSEDRTVREINFVDGVRNGSSVYFFPNGSKMREASFRNGFLHGLLSEFNEQGEVLVEHNYIDGHHCSNEVECSASIR